MKRSIAWLASAAAVISFLFSGCIQNTVSGPTSEYEKLWAVDIGQEGFERADASWEIVRTWTAARTKEDSNLRLTIEPEAYLRENPGLPDVVKKYGREYRTGDGILCRDGLYGGSTFVTRTVQWKHRGLGYQLVMEDSNNGSMTDIASPETAATLEKDPFADISGFPIKESRKLVKFSKGGVTVYIILYPDPTSTEYIKNLPGWVSSGFTDEDGFQFCHYESKEFSEGYKFVNMLWNTDVGVFSMTAQRASQASAPDDALVFVDVELAKSITEQVGGKVMPLDDLLKTPGS